TPIPLGPVWSGRETTRSQSPNTTVAQMTIATRFQLAALADLPETWKLARSFATNASSMLRSAGAEPVLQPPAIAFFPVGHVALALWLPGPDTVELSTR